MLAGDGHVAGDHGADLGLTGGGEVELHRDFGEEVQKVGVGGGDTAGVEEGGQGADLDRDCGGVGRVAGVVLCAASEGDVLEDQTGCWGREGGGCWDDGLVLVVQ